MDDKLRKDFVATAGRAGLPVIVGPSGLSVAGEACELRAVPGFRFDRLLTTAGEPQLDQWLRDIEPTNWLAWRVPRLGWFVARPIEQVAADAPGVRYGGRWCITALVR